MAQSFPNTGSTIEGRKTNTGLSTQIIIKINGVCVGALQKLTANQSRPLERVVEIGTDGVIEIVPKGATTFDLSADRVVFDQLRMPESFGRGFRFINAQRIPFDIEVIDLSGVTTTGATADNTAGMVVTLYKNCWFATYSTPYTADNYVITESATIWCETAFSTSQTADTVGTANGRGDAPQEDTEGIERGINSGSRRGSMDVSGLVNAVFNSDT